MRVGEIFDLPDNVVRVVGRTGIFVDEHNKKIARWVVVKVENEFKGKITTTYGHKRRKA